MNKLTPLPSGTMIDCRRVISIQRKPNENKIIVAIDGQPLPIELTDPADFAPFLEELEKLGHDVAKTRDVFKIPASARPVAKTPSSPANKITFYDVT